MPCYIIQRGTDGAGPVKIGLTSARAARGRIVKMQVDSAEPLVVLRVLEGDRQTEASLHARFRCLRLRGEWFRFDPSMKGGLGIPDFVMPAKAPRRSDGWSAEARVRQSEIQRAVFADPVKGARRRAAFRATVMARTASRWHFSNLVGRCGNLHKMAELLGAPLAEVVMWRTLPSEYAERLAEHIGVPTEHWAHLIAPARPQGAAA